MLTEPQSRVGYRRHRDLFAQIECLASDQWHVTMTLMRPGSWVPDESIPMLELGTFRTSDDACDAADLILDSWSWA